MTRQKRPAREPKSPHAEPTEYLAVWVPRSMSRAIDSRAKALQAGRSAVVRMLLSLALDRQEAHR